MGGGPLTITAHVVALTDGQFIAYGPMGGGAWRNYGLSALLRVSGVEIIVITHNGQATDLAQMTSLGVDRRARTRCLSNRCSISAPPSSPSRGRSSRLISGALATRNFKARPYRHVRRPIFPLDDI